MQRIYEYMGGIPCPMIRGRMYSMHLDENFSEMSCGSFYVKQNSKDKM